MKLRIDFMGLCAYIIQDKAVDVLFVSGPHPHISGLGMDVDWGKAGEIDPLPNTTIGYSGGQLGFWELKDWDIDILKGGVPESPQLTIISGSPSSSCPTAQNREDIRWIADLGGAWGTGKVKSKFIKAPLNTLTPTVVTRFRLRRGTFGCWDFSRDGSANPPITHKFKSGYRQALADICRYEVTIDPPIELRFGAGKILRIQNPPAILHAAAWCFPQHKPGHPNEHFPMFAALPDKTPGNPDEPARDTDCPPLPIAPDSPPFSPPLRAIREAAEGSVQLAGLPLPLPFGGWPIKCPSAKLTA